MVYNGSNPIKMDDLGGPPLFLEGHPYSQILDAEFGMWWSWELGVGERFI